MINLQNIDDNKMTLFTSDAESMYTNINTDKALHEINNYLHKNRQLFLDV